MLPFVWIDPARTFGIQPFGFFVVVAIIVGELLMRRRAKAVGLSDLEMRDLFWWCLLIGLFVSHVLDEIFYHPDQIVARPWSLLFVWEGLSSMGGFVGAVIATVLFKYYRREGLRLVRRDEPVHILPYNDVVQATFPVSWTIARMGCTVVHDHPGALTKASTFLSVAYPSGHGDNVAEKIYGPLVLVWGTEVRHDLGLLEMLYSALIAGVFALTWKKRLPPGFYPAAVSILYAPVRFALDFLRATDVAGADLRHGSLTFAQWACVALFVYGVVSARAVARAMHPRSTAASPSTSGGSSIER